MNAKKNGLAIPSKKNNKAPCILIYDDDAEILFLCKIILSQLNYRVETLQQCNDIISDVKRIMPDIILMDIWIPEIGGEKAVSILKKNQLTNYIPVILFSAHGEVKEISRRVSANGYLEKPFDIKVLKNTIAKNICKD